MQLHTLHSIHIGRRSRRVGRGGKRGTYSGKGIKGQRARAGARIRPAIRDLIKRIPKRRGVRSHRWLPQRSPATVNVEALERHFRDGERVTPKALVEKGLIDRYLGRMPEVKLLGSGTLTRKLLVAECQISQGAREKVEKAGGTVQVS